jgi:hypothetical protein
MKNKIIFSCIHDQRLRAHRIEQLMQKENKSAEEIAELIILQGEDGEIKKEDSDDMEALINDFAGDAGRILSVEDVDFLIGTIYGMLVQRTLDKKLDQEDTDKRIKFSAQLFIQLRNKVVKRMIDQRIPASEIPKKN